ncbi:MAG: Hsp20/alpha crystallin family protein [Gemmatimonadota bacterium]|nr:Hsp20/alpha crystallin family protein [Gemmatimonadota bacterium]
MLYPTVVRRQTPNLWDEMFNIRSEFDRLLGRTDTQVGAGWCPVVDVHETEDALILQAELPGLKADDVSLSVENGVLTISGEKKQQFEEGKEGTEYHLVERRYGHFERRFTLPRTVDPERVVADFSDGILRITLAKAETAKPRRIEIKSRAK